MSLSDDVRVPLDIRLFGVFEVRIDGVLLPPLRARKARWLLALLILHRDHAVERDWLAGQLWPESEERLALYSLRQRLNDLRHALGRESHRLLAPTPRTLLFNLDGAFCDLLSFDQAIRRTEEDDQQEVVAHYCGPLLEGCVETWVLAEREAREQAFLTALERLAQAAIARKNYREAVGFWRRVAFTDPLRESAQRGWMQALAADGDHAAALLVYRELRQMLHRTLNAEPDPETTALFQKIRQEASARASLQTTERLKIRPTEAPSAVSEPASLRRLPVQFTRFFGREEEIARLQRLLLASPPIPSSPRLLTLTGPGGSGKTRLAIETAESLKKSLNGAIWFVPLAGLTEAEQIPGAIVDSTGQRRSPEATLLEQVTGFLNAQEAPVLLILDNFEHLVTRGTPMVRTLLENIPALICLVTSRQPLNLEGEQEFPVASLSVPGSTIPELSDPEHLMQCPSVALFVDRAQSRRPDFCLTAQNAGAVSELCRRLEGIPLAIELAAGWAKTQTPAQMVMQLARRFDFLISTRTDLPPRHLSLHATIEWSYQALSPELQRFFCRLSVFRGGWTAEASEAVCEEPRASEYLAQLVERSLVVGEEQGEAIRFTMLETMGEFGWERMSAKERATLQRQHLLYFLAFAQQAEPNLAGPDQVAWLSCVEREQANVQAAYSWGLEREPKAVLQLAGALGPFWLQRGYLSEGRACLIRTLKQTEVLDYMQERAKALFEVGVLTWAQGDFAAAHSFQKESLEIARGLGDPQGITRSLNNLGNLAQQQGDYATARALWEESLTIRQKLGDKRGMAYTLTNLGILARAEAEDYPASQVFHEESLALFKELEDERGIAHTLGNLGKIAWWRGDYETAATLVQDSLVLSRKLGDRVCLTLNLNRLGLIALHQSNYSQVVALLEEALTIDQELNNDLGVAWTMRNLGVVALHQGDGSHAYSLFQKSLAIHKERGDDRMMADLLEDFAGVACVQRQVERAARLLGAAEALREVFHLRLDPPDRSLHERHVTFVKEALREEIFDAVWAEGRSLSLDQALAYVIAGEPLRINGTPR